MSDRAKLVEQGGRQLVELPKPYRFHGFSEVAISQEGERVVLRAAKRSWSQQFLELAGAAPSFTTVPEPVAPDAAEIRMRADDKP